jgi:protein-S-isoprenylcysteine O-methyltransferase Ste14
MASIIQRVSTSSRVGRWQKLTDFLARWRVEIIATVCRILIVEDFALGFKPHDLADLGDPQALVGLMFVLFGLVYRTWAAGALQTETQLTTIGPYSLVRHTLYVGSFTMLTGFAIIIDNPENIWFVCGPFLYLYMIRVQRDERCMSRQFGAEWQEYVRAPPPFFPRRLSKEAFGVWSWNR